MFSFLTRAVWILALFTAVSAYGATKLTGKQIGHLKLQNRYTEHYIFLGKTTSRRTSEIGFEVAGLVSHIYVNDGEKIKKNQKVAELDTSKLRLRRDQLIAESKEIKSQLTLSRLNLKRKKHLVKDRHIPEVDYDEEKTRMESLSAQLEKVTAMIASIEYDLSKSKLRSPYAATVLSRFVHEGSYVSAGQPILKLQQSAINEAHIGVPKILLSQLSIGKCFTITIARRKRRACVDKILSELTPTTQTVRVLFLIKSNKTIFSGETAALRLSREIDRRGAWVPLSALTQNERGSWLLYTLSNSKKQQKHTVLPIPVHVVYTENNKAYVEGDLKNGMPYIKYGLHNFLRRQKIKIIQEGGLN